jgi:C_GCAxxG_C_C family probable redox protein
MDNTKSKSKAAAAIMKEHKMNCAQTVLTTFCEETGIDYTQALKIAMGFGGGMGRTGRTCGAVTGAYMVFGLAQEITSENPRAVLDTTYALMKKFNEKFTKKHGSMNCKDLLGYDLGKKDERDKANQNGVFKTLCPGFVETSVKILESLLKENKQKSVSE